MIPALPSVVTWQQGGRGFVIVSTTSWKSMPSVVTWTVAKDAIHVEFLLATSVPDQRSISKRTVSWKFNEEIVIKILSITSVWARIRSRCVCRDWKRFADDPHAWEYAYFSSASGRWTREGTWEEDETGRCSAAQGRLEVDLHHLCVMDREEVFSRGIRQVANRCFSSTKGLSLPAMSTHDLEDILRSSPSLQHLHIDKRDHESSCNDNTLVAIARTCKNLTSLKHHLPALHFDPDERYHRSSLRLLCKSNSLRFLDFSSSDKNNEIAVHRLIDALYHVSAISHLSLRNCANVDDRIIKPLMERRIEFLDVRGTKANDHIRHAA
uniref:F-box domain-containing protein n=1 Tax=Guillardia theta TaxID=55529 RepID=A0A6U6E1L5_GUITH|mmetsp:Transcript_875/g.2709  ORF Transcript_875/g.2709 Transcript_875/m.2709 type:complete len:324 (+) Transcript_875:106-1077(+)